MIQNYPFVARSYELSRLYRLYQSSSFQMAIIYGRRRVGKTSLIREFIKDKPVIYSQGIQTIPQQNLNLFANDIASFTKDHPELTPSPENFSNYRDAFTYVQNIANQLDQKLILVLDEYPYFAQSNPAISSELQFVIDHIYKQNSNIMLILCGSSMSFMEKQVLGIKSPLYGRRTAQFKINPFTIFDTKKLLAQVNEDDLLAYYSITGGIPQYLTGIDQNLTLAENIKELFLYPDSILFNEPNALLEQEFNKPEIYFAILTAIAHGKSRFNDIFTATHLNNNSSLVRYLNELIEIGILKSKMPIYSTSNKQKIYQINDGLFRFWFLFIATQQSAINSGRIADLEKRISDQLANFLEPSFEQICKEWLWQAKDLPIEPRDVSNWWGPNPIKKRQEEIDIVAPNYDNTEGIIGECKWRNASNLDSSMIDLLQERALLVPKIHKSYLYFFVKEANSEFLTYAKQHQVTVVEYKNFFE